MPGLATSARRRRRNKLLVATLRSRRTQHSRQRPTVPWQAIRFPPLSSPGLPSAAPIPLWVVWLGGPRRRTLARCFYHFGVRSVRLPPDTLVSGRSQRPVIHRAHLLADQSRSPSCLKRRHPQYAVTPERAVSWRSTSHYAEPPAAEDHGACQSCDIRDTQWKSARSGTEKGCAAALSDPFRPGGFAPLLIYPPRPF